MHIALILDVFNRDELHSMLVLRIYIPRPKQCLYGADE